jgi:guanylate kinase
MIPKTLAQALCKIKKEAEMSDFLSEILTEAEKRDISTRWELILRLKKGETHRKISGDLRMSLCKITRGNKILKNKNSVTNRLLGTKKKKNGKIVVLSAASGAGKSTILSALRKKMPQLVYSISATTRSPREGEKDGVDYFFMSKEDFSAKINDNGFVEWAQVHENYYGTPRDFIEKNLDANKIIVMDIDVQGRMTLNDQYPKNIVAIFIEAPSFEELEARLCKRASENEASMKIRMENARKENNFAKSCGKYDYFIVNDNLEKAVDEICEVLSALSKKRN